MTFVNTKLYFYKTIIACVEIFTQKKKCKISNMKYLCSAACCGYEGVNSL